MSTSSGQVATAAARKPKRIDTEGLSAALTMLLLAGTLAAGWHFSAVGFITPEHGLGYGLGIVGSSMMAVMLIYPFRKRMPSLRILGPVRHWFRAHMMLGVLGPTLIVLHTNFALGSTNSRVALYCMLIVAFSGLGGRYLYRKIHHGLYGQRASLRDLQAQSEALRTEGAVASSLLPDINARLLAFEDALAQRPRLPVAFVLRPLHVNLSTRLMRFRLLREIRSDLDARAGESAAIAAQRQRLLRSAARYLDQRLGASRRIAMFQVYERLFSLWHVLHIPLFALMVIAVFVHIYAVHAY